MTTMTRADFEAKMMDLLPSLKRKASTLTRNDNDAEDLIQETLMLALRKYELYQPGTNLRAWLLRMMTNLYISQYRRSRIRPDNVALSAIGDRPAHEFTGAEVGELQPVEMLRDERFMNSLDDRLKRGLSDLDDRYQEVLLMNAVSGKSYKEISTELKLPMGTVMSRLARAREYIKRSFVTPNVA